MTIININFTADSEIFLKFSKSLVALTFSSWSVLFFYHIELSYLLNTMYSLSYTMYSLSSGERSLLALLVECVCVWLMGGWGDTGVELV